MNRMNSMFGNLVSESEKSGLNRRMQGEFTTVAFYQNISAVPTECGLTSNCNITSESEVCILEDGACIRKYPSKCHMDIAACLQGKEYLDFSADYCAMDTFLCEDGYERWTIFFGHEQSVN